MTKRFRRGQIGLLLLAVLASTVAGCLVPSRETVKDAGWPVASRELPEAGKTSEGQGLIKPYIPPETGESEGDRVVDAPPPPSPVGPPSLPSTVEASPLPPSGPPAVPPAAGGGPPASSPGMPDMDVPPPAAFEQTSPLVPPKPERQPAARIAPTDTRRSAPETPPPVPSPSVPPPVSPTVPQPALPTGAPIAAPQPPAGGKDKLVKPESSVSQEDVKASPGGREWEDQKVRSAARKMVQDSPKVKKWKFCYSAKNDEWWVILYEDTGTVYDVKQYVWNREREKLEPHLVLKTIGKNRLEDHLIARDGDKACEVFDPAN